MGVTRIRGRKTRPVVVCAAVFCVLIAASAGAQTYSRTELTTYHDDTTRWVLGQVKSTTCVQSIPASTLCDGNDVISSTSYTANSQPHEIHAFGKLREVRAYHADGNLASVTDANNNTTSYSNWKRGIPQSISYPATPDQPNGASQTADVDDNGWIRSVTTEVGAKTCYEYDSMGRLSRVVYPSESQTGVCDESKWLERAIRFEPMVEGHYFPPGIVQGQWRQVTTVGNYLKATYFDAMWRPVMDLERDSLNIDGTTRSSRIAYGPDGNVSFTSYPVSGAAASSAGTRTFYDALDRVIRVEQDSEHGVLATRTDYLPGFKIKVTNPRTIATTTEVMAYDLSESWPVKIEEAGRTTHIRRDVYGKPLEITRSGP